MRVRTSGLTVCVVAAVLAGCGGSGEEAGDPTPTPEATSSVQAVIPATPDEPERPATAADAPEGGIHEADVKFAQDMIHHHNQALVMTRWVPDRTSSPSVRLLAKRMEVSQTDEVAFIKKWLEKHGKPAGEHAHGAERMPGMLNEEQLDALQDAQGKRFDQLFLAYMTQHHEGAIQMVQQLWADGGGNEPELSQFAMHVDSDQSIEIKRMAQLAADL
ncbi:DUF305 domain-containing protein [Solirubrobacter sp. CPCC 204708]|uniref:DUF305 domain-containing protein n=1 Tax=Solirubrobacter deserti TaxID=2282478 RepID=A0ABT4RJU5_9ACTN|nr:DUF305 domain-containing protein [Solirubrobacter deserti]MBE2319749.1 DUF305 domain-containing protein [Solirubrobacter deserti]MDA0138770.1 DUF305 domain-containing protein [Solirubrobacter deserti]